MQTERTQAEFESQWRPIPAGDFPLPACPAGMVLLKAFAGTHPHSFEFIQPEDFVHFENEAFTGNGGVGLIRPALPLLPCLPRTLTRRDCMRQRQARGIESNAD